MAKLTSISVMVIPKSFLNNIFDEELEIEEKLKFMKLVLLIKYHVMNNTIFANLDFFHDTN